MKLTLATAIRMPVAPSAPAANNDVLTWSGCTCGLAPQAACLTCARWRRLWRRVRDRRQDWGRPG